MEKGIKSYENEVIKDKEITDIIKYISENELIDMGAFVNRLELIYADEYRHKYSQILQLLIGIEDETIDFLAHNMDILNIYIIKNPCKCAKCFFKLYDHVMLEIIRIRVYHDYEQKEKLIEIKVNTARSEFELVERSVNAVNSNLNDVNNKICNADLQIQNFNTQSISILGIFSAIVVAFFGGLNIMGSIFSNIEKASKYRIIFISALVGFIIYNTIFMLLYFISKILNKDIGTNKWPPENIIRKYYDSKYNYENAEGYKENKVSDLKEIFIKSERKINKYRNASQYGYLKILTRYPIIFCVDVIFITIQVGVTLLWFLNRYGYIFANK